MTSDLYRWQAAMGALTGALVGGALGEGRTTWSDDGMAMLDIAEAHLRGDPLPLDLAPAHAGAVSVALASTASPLLFDPTTVELVDLVRSGLAGNHDADLDGPLGEAARLARGNGFIDAVAAAESDPWLAALVGLFFGLEGGLGAVPAGLISTYRASGGGRRRRYLGGLTNRLLGMEKPNWYDPRRRRGPKEVLPGLWLSNLYGLSKFTADHPDGLVLSLCNDEGRVDGHDHHITFHLEDTPKARANPSLELVVDDVLNEIAQARQAERPVLVHCRHGASRTGLILRILLVEELALSAEDALIEAQCHWSHTSSWNREWTSEVERRADARSDLGG